MYFKLTSFGMCRRLSILDFSARCFFFFCFCSSCIIITNAKIFSCKPINAFNIICIIICLEIAKIKCTLIFVIKKSSNSHRQKKIECSKSAYMDLHFYHSLYLIMQVIAEGIWHHCLYLFMLLC